jgi:hypothetical protein
MLKRLTILALLVQLPALAALGETKEGTCQLKRSGPFDKDAFTVAIGEKIKGTCKFRIVDFFGKETIDAGVTIVNTSDKPMHCQYYVAFFDERGTLLGCAGQGTFGAKGLAAGESTQLGSCLIPLPTGLAEKAVRYKIAFYESDREIGKGPAGGAPRRNADGAEAPATASPRQSAAIVRTWTDATGQHTVTAKLVECKDGVVRLTKGNGQIVSLPLDKLSEADRKFLSSGTNDTGTESSAHRSKQANARSGRAASKTADTNPSPAKWYSAGPGWQKLNQLAQFQGVSLFATNHGKTQYEEILSKSQAGSMIILLFALDSSDKSVPAGYEDLLPIPWNQVEAKLRKGETIEGSGKARDRQIVMLAAPTEQQLNDLIRTTKLLPSSPRNR